MRERRDWAQYVLDDEEREPINVTQGFQRVSGTDETALARWYAGHQEAARFEADRCAARAARSFRLAILAGVGGWFAPGWVSAALWLAFVGLAVDAMWQAERRLSYMRDATH